MLEYGQTINFEVKALQDTGTFEGYASTYSNTAASTYRYTGTGPYGHTGTTRIGCCLPQ